MQKKQQKTTNAMYFPGMYVFYLFISFVIKGLCIYSYNLALTKQNIIMCEQFPRYL